MISITLPQKLTAGGVHQTMTHSRCPFLNRVSANFLRHAGKSLTLYGQSCPMVSRLICNKASSTIRTIGLCSSSITRHVTLCHLSCMCVDVASKGPVQLRVSSRPWSATATEPKPDAKGELATAPQPRVGFIMCVEC